MTPGAPPPANRAHACGRPAAALRVARLDRVRDGWRHARASRRRRTQNPVAAAQRRNSLAAATPTSPCRASMSSTSARSSTTCRAFSSGRRPSALGSRSTPTPTAWNSRLPSNGRGNRRHGIGGTAAIFVPASKLACAGCPARAHGVSLGGGHAILEWRSAPILSVLSRLRAGAGRRTFPLAAFRGRYTARISLYNSCSQLSSAA